MRWRQEDHCEFKNSIGHVVSLWPSWFRKQDLFSKKKKEKGRGREGGRKEKMEGRREGGKKLQQQQ